MNEDRQDVMMNAFCHAATMCFSAIAENAGCPHVVMRPRIFMDGKEWCASYGDMPEGVQGFGKSPDTAMRDFDKNWYATKEPTDEH